MTSSTARRFRSAVLAGGVALACHSAVLYAQVDGFDDRLRPTVQTLLKEGNQNFVLNHMRLGVQAMEIGQFDVAARSFDEVLANITAIYADNEAAARARSLWYAEGSKDFRGEPYERVMAFYYRGLLDMMQGDYDNARASFRSGLLQDAFAEEEQNRADFALMLYLDGWCSHLLGDSMNAKEAFDEALKFRPDLKLPAPGDNVLVIAESGPSPRKLADGVGHAELVYRRGRRFTEQRAALDTSSGRLDLYPMEDIFWQAATRGGRPIDAVLKGQVRFRATTEGIGTVLTSASEAMTSASFQMGQSSGGGTANVIGVVGIVALALSSRTKAQADTRHWDNLPDAVHVASAKVAAGVQPGWVVTYLNQAGAEVAGLGRPVQIHWDERGNGLVWVRSRYSVEP